MYIVRNATDAALGCIDGSSNSTGRKKHKGAVFPSDADRTFFPTLAPRKSIKRKALASLDALEATDRTRLNPIVAQTTIDRPDSMVSFSGFTPGEAPCPDSADLLDAWWESEMGFLIENPM